MAMMFDVVGCSTESSCRMWHVAVSCEMRDVRDKTFLRRHSPRHDDVILLMT